MPGFGLSLRGYATDIAAPILDTLEKPLRATAAGLDRLAGVSDIYVENERLRGQNDVLRQWELEAQRLLGENEQLRNLLKAPGREISPSATGRVVGIGGGAFERSLILNVGKRHGVRRNQPAVDAGGVLGRIITVGLWSSRVLLVTDLNSRVPVRIEGTGTLGILEGRNDPLMQLRFLPGDERVNEGALLVTSGHGGAFPADLPVGRVASVSGDVILVQPLALLNTVDRVRVLDYFALPPEETITPQEGADGGEAQTESKGEGS